jgi:acetyltransferase
VIRLLLKLSTLACALPWVVEVELDPLAVIEGEVIASGVRIVADRRRAGIAGYAHMAIHPYPAELASEFVARNGVHVHIRPILPEDAQREQRFVAGLSEQTRFFRFFYRMHQLTPAMLARFTQVDYDREMALVALVDDADGVEGLSFVAVARYIENPDGISAEYAVVVADAWQAQGVGRALMERLIAVARRNGLRRLEGAVLKENVNMLKFVAGLGFSTRNDPQDGDEVITYLELA